MRRSMTHALLLAVLVGALLPQAFVLQAAWTGPEAVWTAAPAMVWGMVANTGVVAAVAVGVALVIGCTAAWLVVRGDVAIRRWWSVLLCLPFAVPSFAYASILVGLDARDWPLPGGPVGGGLILGLTLYPWIYVPLRATLARQSRHLHELAATLGMGPWRRWWRVELPLLLPTIGTTALLVLMAVLNDFGTAGLLGVKTLSVGVHEAMFSMLRRDWAAQLSLLGLAMPAVAVLGFVLIDRQRAVYQPANRGEPIAPARWRLPGRVLATGWLGLIVGVSLFLPLGLLAERAWPALARMSLAALPGQVLHTALVTAAVVGIGLVAALWLALAMRRPGLGAWRGLGWVFYLNYAIPSSMLAIALLFTTAVLPRAAVGLVLSDTCILLVAGSLLTYLCFPVAVISSGLATIPRSLDDLCAVNGLRGVSRLTRVELPLLSRHLACAALLVAVLVAQELPLTLILQPFDFQTLGLRMYDLARVELLRPAAVYALVMIALLVYPVIVLDRLIMGERDAPA